MRAPPSLRLPLALLLLFLAGCASEPRVKEAPTAPTPPPQRPREETRGDCNRFCEIIAQCAAKGHREKYARRLCRTARCETGQKCTGDIESPNGRYRGAFQFAAATWLEKCDRVFARRGMEECRPFEGAYDLCCATVCAAEIFAHGGSRNWPTCGRR